MSTLSLHALFTTTLLSAAALAQSTPPASAPVNLATLTPEQWRADLHQLADTLPSKHPDPFTHTSREAWTDAVASLDADIPNLSPHQVAFSFLRLTASLGDSHTFIRINNIDPPLQAYPLHLFWFEDGLTVIAADKGYDNLLGARLTHINHSPIDTVLQSLTPYVAHENQSFFKSSIANTLPTAQALLAARVITTTDVVPFTFSSPDAGEFEQSLSPLSPDASPDWQRWLPPADAPTPLSRKRPNAWYWSELHQPSNALYIQYNRCASAKDLPFDDFAEQALAFIDDHKPSAVIIDLRNNGGGNSAIARPLIQGLAQRDAINQPNRIFVLIGRQTFSSALLNAIELKQKTNATLIGEPTGGKPNHFGEVRSFILTHSGLTVFHSTKFFKSLPDDPHSLIPDIHTPVRSTDYIRGADPAFDAAIERIPR